MKKTLRPYQAAAIEDCRRFVAEGKKRIIVHLPTGAGKGVILVEIALNAMEKDKRVLFLVKGREIVFQTVRLFKTAGLSDDEFSIEMGSESTNNDQARLKVASVDTLQKRGLGSPYDLCIVDEMHLSTSNGYQNIFASLGEIVFIGLSATPYHVGRKGHTFWECFTRPETAASLRDQNYLTHLKIYSKKVINTKGVKTVAGDFDKKGLAEESMKVIGDVLATYKELGEGKQALGFAVNVDHAIQLTDAFNADGIPSEIIEAKTPKKEREKILDDFRAEKLQIIFNVGTLTTGVDLPQTEVCIMARPTKSLTLWIQMAGRVLRPYRVCGGCKKTYDNSARCYHCGHDKPTYIKEYAIMLDHGENTKRLGSPFKEHEPVFEDVPKGTRTASVDTGIRTCQKCFFVWEKADGLKCPACGTPPDIKDKTLSTADRLELLEDTKAKNENILQRMEKDGTKYLLEFSILKERRDQLHETKLWPEKILYRKYGKAAFLTEGYNPFYIYTLLKYKKITTDDIPLKHKASVLQFLSKRK